jgi:predicted acylesterase/phospholipase RssA
LQHIDYSSLTPDQVADLRRKLESAGCQVPADAITPAQLEAPLAAFRKQAGIHASGPLDEATWKRLNQEAGSVFSEVFQNELDLLRPRPGSGAGPDEVAPANWQQVLQRAHGDALFGLALSGGGVRSATFNLGVLQALGQEQLLRDVDYLSTVSGGGFIGGWLSKWIREKHGDVRAVEAMLTPGAAGDAVASEPVEIQFLRQYSNYLSPRSGMFSADTWTLIGSYVRNTGLNLTMLVAWLCALLTLPRFAVWAVQRIIGPHGPWGAWSDPAWMLGTVAFLFAVFCIALSISSKPERSSRGQRRFPLNQGAVLWCVNLPLLLSGFLVSIGLWRHGGETPSFWHAARQAHFEAGLGWLLAPGFVYFVVWACGWYLAHDRTSPYRRVGYLLCGAGAVVVAWLLLAGARQFAAGAVDPLIAPAIAQALVRFVFPGLIALFLMAAAALLLLQLLGRGHPSPDLSRAELWEGMSHFLCAMGALTIGTILLVVGLSLMPDPARHPVLNNAIALTTFGMPLMMTLFSVTMTLMIGLIGRMYSDASREWWSRQGAWSSIFSLAWLMMFGVAFFFAPLLHWAWLTYEPLTNAGTAIGWLAMTWLGLKAGSGSATGIKGATSRLDVIARLAPYLFTLGIFALLSTLVQAIVNWPEVRCARLSLECVYAAHADAALHSSGARLSIAFAAFLSAALLLGWRVDINKFSLYMMYRNRLVRAYFGASNPKRKPHPFTGFDPNDDPQFADLQDQKPYHIVNTCLNLVSGEELAWQTRKAASFVFTPRYCGFETPLMPAQGDNLPLRDAQRGAYRPTRQYASRSGMGADDDAKVKLGMAVALSGAAASPNMGSHSSPPLNFLMTMFNVRLGRWCPNPRKGAWTSSSPAIGLFSLIAELFGMTNADANYVYLSDGGHFENLGIYELVRRRCRLIVAVDVASDKNFAFEDLGNAIRKCATDLHVGIELCVSRMEKVVGTDLCGTSCAAGRICYSHADKGGVDGVLLYVKPAIVGTENADVLNYRKAHPDYPHQSTADQWFDEAQFESYRALGYHIAKTALADAAEVCRRGDGSHDIDMLCAELMRRHCGPVRYEEPAEVASETAAAGCGCGKNGRVGS